MIKTIIQNNSRKTFDFKQTFKDLYQYRDLISILAWRDYKVRYAQTILGVAWAVIQPITTLIIFTFIFGKVAKFQTGNIPYAIYVQSGMIVWTYFSFLISQVGNSVVGAQSMIKKIFFPRLVIPISKSIVGLIDFLISFVLFLFLCIYYQFVPSVSIFYLPIVIAIIIIGGLGAGFWVSALTVRFRDFSHVIPFIIQIGLYVSPIAYPISEIPAKYKFLYNLNPMVGVIKAVRNCFFNDFSIDTTIIYSTVIMVGLFISGMIYFKKVEKVMADIL